MPKLEPSRREFIHNISVSMATFGLSFAQPAMAKKVVPKVPEPSKIKREAVFNYDDMMPYQAHGTCSVPVNENLRFGVDNGLADRIGCYNKIFAEPKGYFAERPELES